MKGNQLIGKKNAFQQALGRAGKRAIDRSTRIASEVVFRLGGTLANLRGYVEARGGFVIAITTLTESRDAKRISLRPETRDMLRDRHGEELDQLWRAQFGHGIDCLTEVEALQLCRQQSVAGIEDFLAKAAIEARSRGLAPAV